MEFTLFQLTVVSRIYILVIALLNFGVFSFLTIPDFFHDVSIDNLPDSIWLWLCISLTVFLAWNVIHNFTAIIKSTKLRKHIPGYSGPIESELPGRWCTQCEAPKPWRSHHCPICRKCILKRDHHCFLFDECIGLYNQGPFTLFLLHSAVSLHYALFFLITYAQTQFYPLTLSNVFRFYVFPFNLAQWLIFGNFQFQVILLSVLIGLTLTMALGSLCYGCLQAYLLVSDLTWYEFRRGTRGRAGPARWPRSLRNCLGPRWYLAWALPCLLSDPNDHDSDIKQV